ncbi:MAG: hypothetical protein Q8M92_10715 [Candidatus Subteraquimicrobiales bacterium]|nr:hypothetical protein [Candidatus Subteraquimicrobiales bacterium]
MVLVTLNIKFGAAFDDTGYAYKHYFKICPVCKKERTDIDVVNLWDILDPKSNKGVYYNMKTVVGAANGGVIKCENCDTQFKLVGFINDYYSVDEDGLWEFEDGKREKGG